jgi:hypothetical protein
MLRWRLIDRTRADDMAAICRYGEHDHDRDGTHDTGTSAPNGAHV